jgi:hypothetical protein
LLQAAVGIAPADAKPMRKASKNGLHRELISSRIAEIRAAIETGGLREAAVRALLYVGMPRAAIDERGMEALRRIRSVGEGARKMTVAEFKAMVRLQFFMLLIDQDAALAAIPKMLPTELTARRRAFGSIREVLSARGAISGEVANRLGQIAGIFGLEHAEEALPAPSIARIEDGRRRNRGRHDAERSRPPAPRTH